MYPLLTAIEQEAAALLPEPTLEWQQGYEAAWKRLHEPDAIHERLADAIELAFEEGWVKSDHPLADVTDFIAARLSESPKP